MGWAGMALDWQGHEPANEAVQVDDILFILMLSESGQLCWKLKFRAVRSAKFTLRVHRDRTQPLL
jgi:hypothetical protein